MWPSRKEKKRNKNFKIKNKSKVGRIFDKIISLVDELFLLCPLSSTSPKSCQKSTNDLALISIEYFFSHFHF